MPQNKLRRHSFTLNGQNAVRRPAPPPRTSAHDDVATRQGQAGNDFPRSYAPRGNGLRAAPRRAQRRSAKSIRTLSSGPFRAPMASTLSSSSFLRSAWERSSCRSAASSASIGEVNPDPFFRAVPRPNAFHVFLVPTLRVGTVFVPLRGELSVDRRSQSGPFLQGRAAPNGVHVVKCPSGREIGPKRGSDRVLRNSCHPERTGFVRAIMRKAVKSVRRELGLIHADPSAGHPEEVGLTSV